MKLFSVLLIITLFFIGCANTTKNKLLKENSSKYVGYIYNIKYKNCLGNGELLILTDRNIFYSEFNKVAYNGKQVSFSDSGEVINNTITTNLDGYTFNGKISPSNIFMKYSNKICKNGELTLKKKK